MSSPALTTTTDLAEARALGERAYYPHRLSYASGARGGLRMRLESAALTPEVTVGRLGYGAATRLDCGRLGSGFQVNVPVRGTAVSTCGDQRVVGTPRCAAVFTPDAESAIELWGADCVQLGVRLDGALIGRLLRRDPARTRFRHGFGLDSAARAAWVQLVVGTLALAASLPAGAREQVAPHLARSLALGFLHCSDHDLRDALDRVECAPTKLLRRATRDIEERQAEPLDVAALAARCGVGVRTLQVEFARHLGMGPGAYRRRVAMESAHADLVRADPARHTVAEIACRWGFFHLGRFARDHRERYGTLPSGVLADGERLRGVD